MKLHQLIGLLALLSVGCDPAPPSLDGRWTGVPTSHGERLWRWVEWRFEPDRRWRVVIVWTDDSLATDTLRRTEEWGTYLIGKPSASDPAHYPLALMYYEYGDYVNQRWVGQEIEACYRTDSLGAPMVFVPWPKAEGRVRVWGDSLELSYPIAGHPKGVVSSATLRLRSISR